MSSFCLNIDKTKPVLVTGATGYVAGELIRKLLKEGVIVHAAVRNPDDEEKLKFLNEISKKYNGTIRYFKADLLEENSYLGAMEGCEIVFHTASPFKVKVDDPQKDLLDPAKLGTRNVLKTVEMVDSVKRVILTSSCAAIYADNAECSNTKNNIFTEENWNTTSSIHHSPYSYSKTLAEKEAWDIHDRQSRWRLVVINPSLVIGPSINPHPTSESFSIIKQFGDGSMQRGVPKWGVGLVDVRDVAEAHIRAAFIPAASGRYIICGHNSSFHKIAEVLNGSYGKDYPIPTRILPKWLVWLVAPFFNKGMTRNTICRNVNYDSKLDNRKSIKELQMTYLPVEKSINDFFQQMIDAKLL